MHYLLLGADPSFKDASLTRIKAAVLTAPDSFSLDFESLDAHKLSAQQLKISLLSLAGVSRQRLIHIRQAERLSRENLALIDSYLKAGYDNTVLILDALLWETKSEVKKSIFSNVEVLGRAEGQGVTAFDMMRRVQAGDMAGALKMLHALGGQDESPERVLGAMFWAWSNRTKSAISSVKYKKGLLILQEADNHLKRSRFPQRDHAVELALVKLSSLMTSPAA